MRSTETDHLSSFFGGGAGSFGLDRFQINFSHFGLHDRGCRGGGGQVVSRRSTNADCPVCGDRNDGNFHRHPRSGAVSILAFLVEFVDLIADRDIRSDAISHIIENFFGQPVFPKTSSRAETPRRAIQSHRFHNADLLRRIVIQQKRRSTRVQERQINAAGLVVENFNAERALNRLFRRDSDLHAARVSVDDLILKRHSAGFNAIARIPNFLQFRLFLNLGRLDVIFFHGAVLHFTGDHIKFTAVLHRARFFGRRLKLDRLKVVPLQPCPRLGNSEKLRAKTDRLNLAGSVLDAEDVVNATATAVVAAAEAVVLAGIFDAGGMFIGIRPLTRSTDRIDLRQRRESMPDQSLGRLTITEDADQCSGIFRCSIDRELAVRNAQGAFPHDVFDLAARHAARRIPLHEVSDPQGVRSSAVAHVVVLFILRFIFHDVFGPRLASVPAPKRPRDATIGRITIFAGAETLGLLVHLMAGEETPHALDGVQRQVLAIHDVTSAGNADLGATAPELAPPIKAALGFLFHAACRFIRHCHRPPPEPQRAAWRRTAHMPSTGRTGPPSPCLARSARRFPPRHGHRSPRCPCG